MAQSPTRIVQRAMVLLGTSQRISSIDDGTPLAQAARDVFDDCRDEVLAEHPWNFAVTRASIPVSADYTGDDEWELGYDLPGDCLRWLPWPKAHALGFVGVREGRFILTNETAPLTVRYIARIEDAAQWSPGFCEALSGKIAMWLASAAPVQSEVSAQRAARIYETALSRGRRQDAMENGDTDRQNIYRSDWLNSREGAAPIVS